MDPSFIGALIDGSPNAEWSTVRILGRRLRKFSLWHRLLLSAFQSPFVTGEPVTLRDLRIAVAVCSLAFPDSKTRLPWVMPFLSRLWLVVRAIVSRGKKDKGGDNVVQADLRKQVEAFVFYTKDYLQEPEYTVIPLESNGIPSKPETPRGRAPEVMEHVAELIAFTHWDDKKIWNLPIGYANWLKVMAIKHKGADVSFVTEDERKFQAKLGPEYRRKK